MVSVGNLSIKVKFFIGFFFLSAIVCFVGYKSNQALFAINDYSKEMYADRLLPVKDLGEIRFNIMAIKLDVRNLLLSKLENKSAITLKIEGELGAIEKLFEGYSKTKLDNYEEVRIPYFQENWGKYKAMVYHALELAQTAPLSEVMDYLTVTVPPQSDKVFNTVQELLNYNQNRAHELNEQVAAEYNRTDTNSKLGVALSVLFAMLLGYYFSSTIGNPLQTITKTADEIAGGNFALSIQTYAQKDEIGKLSVALREMTSKVLDKMFWYEQLLDAIPFPVLVTDTEKNILFVNTKGEELMKANRKELLGHQCSKWNAAICRTDECAIQKLKKNQPQTFLDEAKTNFQIDTTFVRNLKGEVTGHIEVVQDISQMKQMEIYLSSSASLMLVEMNKLATGDLTVKLPVTTKDDIGELFTGFNQSIETIAKALTSVMEAVQATASASTQISSSTEEMAAGAEEQSAQANEVASAIEEMTKTIFETSQNTSFAAETAKIAGDKAKHGGEVVQLTISGMEKISKVVNQSAHKVYTLGQNSEKIGEIAQVIDEIADQTNLLALNAAIEAARAGEQGRGFAVVADEVRKLAERTAKATKEIADMIKMIQKDTSEAVASMQQGVKEVEEGKKLAIEAGGVLEEIVQGATKVTDIVVQVAATSEEQSATAEQIGKNMEGINSVLHETSSGIQQIAHSIEDLNKLTENLQRQISQFQLSAHQTTGLRRQHKELTL